MIPTSRKTRNFTVTFIVSFSYANKKSFQLKVQFQKPSLVSYQGEVEMISGLLISLASAYLIGIAIAALIPDA